MLYTPQVLAVLVRDRQRAVARAISCACRAFGCGAVLAALVYALGAGLTTLGALRRRTGYREGVTVIGVVSDTHFPRFGRALPRALERGLRRAGVTRILHLGDMTDLLAVPLFEAIAPFDAVAGNNDGAAIRERFGRRKIVRVEDVRIGMIHGDGRRGTTKSRALDAFAEPAARPT